MHRFIHIPKNGGSAVRDWLVKNNIPFLLGKSSKRAGKHKKAIFWQDEPTIKFCVVRHPYTRTISYFNYVAEVESWTLFEDFVKNKQDPVTFRIPTPWALQSAWILDDQGRELCEKIFRYEQLESQLQEYFECSKPLLVANQTKTKLVTEQDLTPELKQIIFEHHREDFERFGYAP